MSPEGMIAVIVAQSQGKTIEARNLYLVAKGVVNWIEPEHLEYGFDFIGWEYRIKREPREPRVIWVNEYDSGCRWGMPALSEKCAREHKGANAIGTRKFIEVTE